MESIPHWNGRVTGLRIMLEMMMKGATIEFVGLVTSTKPVDQISSPTTKASFHVTPVGTLPPHKSERHMACSRTVLSIHELIPTPGMSTYIERPYNSPVFDSQRQLALVKFVASLIVNQRSISVSQATQVRITQKPDRLLADYSLGGTQVHVETLPLRSVSDTVEDEGASLFKIATNPATPLYIDCGGMAEMSVWQREVWLREVAVGNPSNRVEIRGGVALIRHSDISRTVALRASGKVSVVTDRQTPHVRVDLADGQGWILATFARGGPRPEAERAGRGQRRAEHGGFLRRSTGA